MRILCYLLGCREDPAWPICVRCGADGRNHDHDYDCDPWSPENDPSPDDKPWLPPGPITRALWRWKDFLAWLDSFRCGQCRCFSLGKYQRDTGFCCDECHRKYLWR